jgi:mediator of RNA polymerase II transcription subunit 31
MDVDLPSSVGDVKTGDSSAPSSSSPPRGVPEDVYAHINAIAKCDKMRFILELEFVELLANPHMLQHLSINRYLEEEAFCNYLQYLQYWKQPAYAKHITHPHALYFLEKLQSEAYRQQLADPGFVRLLHTNQYWHWQTYRANRAKEQQSITGRRLEEQGAVLESKSHVEGA